MRDADPASTAPDPAELVDQAEFREQLRQLMRSAGLGSLQQLHDAAKRCGVHLPVSTADRALNTDRLPTADFVRRFVTACGGDIRAWQAARDMVADRKYQRDPDPVPTTEPADRVPDCPYPGLGSFEADQAQWFFGRDRAIAEMIAHLTNRLDGAGGPMIVTAPSGTGKSSLLKAGLIPALRRGAIPGSPDWPVVLCTPTAGLPEHGPQERRTVVIVDQFEEVFTQWPDEMQRATFIQSLCSRAEHGQLVVLGLRADFYGNCAAYPPLVASLRQGHLLLGAMNADELRTAIERPARAAGLELEPGLVDLLLADLGATPSGYEPGALPLLAHALFATWQHRTGGSLTIAGYRLAGGLHGAIAATAEYAYARLHPAAQEIARYLLLRLVQIGDGAQDTRRWRDRAQLINESSDPHAATQVLEALATARLVTVDATTVEITHEALLRAWPRLRAWLNDDRAGLLVQQRLTAAAEEWDREGRDPSALYRGSRLAMARDLVAVAQLPDPVREFLALSTRQEDAEQRAGRRRLRRLRALVAALSVLIIVAASATVAAVRAETNATRQRNEALSRDVAGDAAVLRARDPALANQLGLAAYRLAPTAEARGTVLSAFATPYSVLLSGHRGFVNQVTFSPDGRTVATASSDDTARLWDLSGTARVTLSGHTGDVTAIAFSPDGRTIATASSDHTARLWDLSGKPRATLTGHTDGLIAVAFSPDGHTIATASTDHTARLWNTSATQLATTGDTGAALHDIAFAPGGDTLAVAMDDGRAALWTPTGSPALDTIPHAHRGATHDVTFSPDGHTLATAGADGIARLWPVSDPHAPLAVLSVLSGHPEALYETNFSADGATLATASADNTVRLWDVTNPTTPTIRSQIATQPGVRGDTDDVTSAAFSPDGRLVATASFDYTARIWTVARPMVTGHTGVVRPMALAPNQDTLATVDSADGTVRWWRITDPYQPTPVATMRATGPRPPQTVAFSTDGRRLVTIGDDHIARLHDITHPRTPTLLTTLPVAAEAGDVVLAIFSPDGRTLITVAIRGRTGQLWDLAHPRTPQLVSTMDLTRHASAISTLAVSPDGRMLATASYDHTARLWDISNRTKPRSRGVVIGHGDTVLVATFSPDGRMLATSSADHTARLWQITNPDRPRALSTLTGHTDYLEAIAFSPDGHTLVTGSGDRTARLWNVTNTRDPQPLATLTGHNGAIHSATFSTDGRLLITGSGDHTALIWETNPERTIERICAAPGPPLTTTQWETHFPGLPADLPCPTKKAH